MVLVLVDIMFWTLLTRTRGRCIYVGIGQASLDQSCVAQWGGAQNTSAKIPVVEAPGSIPARSQVGLCGEYSILGSFSRISRGIFFPSFLDLSYGYSTIAKCPVQPIRK